MFAGAHAAVLIFDPTRKETFDYVLRELERVPKALDILVLVPFFFVFLVARNSQIL